jgi:hypothetical protein
VLDPLPILARRKDDEEPDDDNESLETILDKRDRKPGPEDIKADSAANSRKKKQ